MRQHSISLSLLVAALCLTVVPGVKAQGNPVFANGRPDSTLIRRFGVIDGVVSDTNLAPLHAAFVSIVGTKIRVGTGPNGRFRIVDVPAGQYLLVVRRVGFHPASSTIELAPHDTLRLSYMLEPAPAAELAPVVVTAAVQSKRMRDFDARRKFGVGIFLTDSAIEAHHAVFSTELFRGYPQINVSPDNSTAVTQYYALSAREGANPSLGACPMSVLLDRVPLPTPFNLDLLPPPRDLEGIEIYPGPSTTPPQFAGFNKGCGVILVWTKEGY
jgi:hypothetical protein